MKTNEFYIQNYINGSLSEEEMREFDMLISTSPKFAAKVQQVKYNFHLFDNLEAQKKIDVDVAWLKVNKKIKRSSTRRQIWNITRNVAAVLLPLFLLFQYVVQPLMMEAQVIETITLSSAPGVITKSILPDGSEVWLNSQSELTYPRKFTNKERTVQLKGEAYFKVTSDKENRFNVITPSKTVVSAYGTEFNINAYTEDDFHSITLTKGNVDISFLNNSKKRSLLPNQIAVVNTDDTTIDIKNGDTYVETAWKDGKMVFRKENIKTMAEKLSRKFGIIIQVEENVSYNYEFTATFIDETLEDILELLKLSSSIDYSISKREKLPDDSYTQRIVTIKCI